MRTREGDLRNALSNPNGHDQDKDAKDAAKDKEVKTPSPTIDPKNAKDVTGENVDADKPADYQLMRAIDLLRGVSMYGRFQQTQTPEPKTSAAPEPQPQ